MLKFRDAAQRYKEDGAEGRPTDKTPLSAVTVETIETTSVRREAKLHIGRNTGEVKMNRRNFLQSVIALLVAEAAPRLIPFGRVWSFPKEIAHFPLRLEELSDQIPAQVYRCFQLSFIKALAGAPPVARF